MAMDERLKRQGLYHLKDKPKELRRELERRVEAEKKDGVLPAREEPTPTMDAPETNSKLVLEKLRENRRKNHTPKLRKRDN